MKGREPAEQVSGFSYTAGNVKAQVAYEPMPYGRVLIVDDVDINLYLAQRFLSPWQLITETVTSGFAALEKVGSGEVYDIIFMDYMMPKMNGIETTRKLRELGYTGTIVALTAVTPAGSDEIFKSEVFDWFISKPIDIHQLETVVNRFIRDGSPEKAAMYNGIETSPPTSDTAIHPRVVSAFLRDAARALNTVKETAKNGDIKLFTMTVHSMKSALINIAEKESSDMAAALENAGCENNMDFIVQNTGAFILRLSELIKKYGTQEQAVQNTPENTAEDKVFLTEQMSVIKIACGDYDDETAYAAIASLKEKKWSKDTVAIIEEINDTLRLRSDFEKAAELAANVCRCGMPRLK